MPFYEYQCRACGAQAEVLQKITDAPLRKCPECGRLKLVKLVSAPVFRLKGSGWYETDFKSEGEKKHNLASSDEATAAPKAKEETKEKTKEKTKGEAKGKAKPVPATAAATAKTD